MKSVFLTIFCSILILSACSTIDKAHKTDRPSAWSTSNPLSIPYNMRLQQFKKGNLVSNSSFENGRIMADPPANTFVLDGWQKIGQNVDWVTQEPGVKVGGEVSSGRHSIKVNRKKATELDEAEGIISDYIPVIPGNYYFSYRIKLKDIVSNKYRLGVKLYDAIVIKVLFFDEHREPVNPGYLNPNTATIIDNSAKNYSFSNYWRIDDFPWGTVRGRSYNYPFSEGDIPARARFVRLFFGLKGTGTLWLDDIDFRFSKWNFTALERFKPFFTRQLTLEEKIIPTPKKFRWVNDVVYYKAGIPNAFLPVIVLPENPASAERTAAGILQKQINKVLDKCIPAKNHDTIKVRVLEGNLGLADISNAKLVLSIGRNKIYEEVQPDLPLQSLDDSQQGYVIQTEQVGNSDVVFLLGQTPIANFNAVATAVQLFENDECIYHNATVIDYPDFLGRSYMFENWKDKKELQNDLDAVERMSLYKFNMVYFGYNRAKKTWYQIDSLYRDGVRAAGKKFKESGVMSLAVMVNPYSHFKMGQSAETLSDQLRYKWTHSSPQSFRMLQDVFKMGLDAGADTMMLLSDDYVPYSGKNRYNYSLYTSEDKKKFVNLQNAQAHLINKLQQWINTAYPNTRFEFCPPWYSNEHIDRSNGKAELYFQELTFQIPPDVAVIWTGSTVRSLSIDMADLHRYRSLIGRYPMIWDNTLYARNLEAKRYGGYTTYYPGKVRMCNLFEPYQTYRPRDFQRYNHGRQMYTNHSAYSEIYKIKYATVADYEWNTAAYNPELSLWKVLCRTYGPAAAKKLILFSDAYYGIYGTCWRIEIEGRKDEYIDTGKKFLKGLDNILLDISKALPESKKLLQELKNFKDKQKTRFEKLSLGGARKEGAAES
jgi:beta-N-acetylglucosaminidase